MLEIICIPVTINSQKNKRALTKWNESLFMYCILSCAFIACCHYEIEFLAGLLRRNKAPLSKLLLRMFPYYPLETLPTAILFYMLVIVVVFIHYIFITEHCV